MKQLINHIRTLKIMQHVIIIHQGHTIFHASIKVIQYDKMKSEVHQFHASSCFHASDPYTADRQTPSSQILMQVGQVVKARAPPEGQNSRSSISQECTGGSGGQPCSSLPSKHCGTPSHRHHSGTHVPSWQLNSDLLQFCHARGDPYGRFLLLSCLSLLFFFSNSGVLSDTMSGIPLSRC